MKRATGKKLTSVNSRIIMFVIWCYGGKFICPILMLAFSYIACFAKADKLINLDINKIPDDSILGARVLVLFSAILHFGKVQFFVIKKFKNFVNFNFSCNFNDIRASRTFIVAKESIQESFMVNIINYFVNELY